MTPRLIYDPGGDNVEDLDSMLLCIQALVATVGSLNLRPAAFREGEFDVNDDCAKMFSVLFDSGAVHRSYISKEIVEAHREAWKSNILPYNSTVRLADQWTTVRTTEMVRGKLSFVFDNGVEISGDIDAVVWEMPQMDFILGLPDILIHFLELFISMLKIAREEMVLGMATSKELIKDTDMEQNEEREWATGEVEESEEELMTPVPVQFGGVLNYMETSYEESVLEYMKSLDDHVGCYLKDCPEFMELLKSKLAMDRFAPKEWSGIKGFEPLDLQTREDLPPFHKVKTRPVNPALLENAHKEFIRLSKYIYNVESKSPWASALVIAYKATKPWIRYCGDHRWLNQYLICPQAYIPHVQYEIDKIIGYKIMMDIDLANAFHQFPITPRSSQLLAVQTPWGLAEPKFMAEGISVATGHLQQRMMQMFHDFSEWAVVIFDNILLLAHDHADAVEKLKRFLQRCEEHNVYLKMSNVTDCGLSKRINCGLLR